MDTHCIQNIISQGNEFKNCRRSKMKLQCNVQRVRWNDSNVTCVVLNGLGLTTYTLCLDLLYLAALQDCSPKHIDWFVLTFVVVLSKWCFLFQSSWNPRLAHVYKSPKTRNSQNKQKNIIKQSYVYVWTWRQRETIEKCPLPKKGGRSKCTSTNSTSVKFYAHSPYIPFT